MAYTQEQIDGARAWAVGKTGAEIQAAAADLKLSAADLGNVLGYTPEQVTAAGYGSSTGFNSDVANATWGGYQAPAPAPSPSYDYSPSPAPAPSYSAPAPSWSQDQINSAYSSLRNSGENDDGIWKAGSSKYGITQDQFNLAKMAYAPTPAPAPAAPSWTQEQLNAAYATERNKGSSNSDLYRLASSQYNVTPEQFAAAEKAYANSVPQTSRFTPEQFAGAKQWANGKTATEILNKASEMGLTPEEMAQLFGVTTKQLQDMTGYGTGISGFNADGSFKYNPTWNAGIMATGASADFLVYDAENNTWKPKPQQTQQPLPTAPKPNTPIVTGTSGTGSSVTGTGSAVPQNPFSTIPGMPGTGINLSQVSNTATPWEVAKNQTVQSQLEQIIAADSPLMQQARMRALQAANSRGLLNSSMAISAGESALYDAAMPIAQQDASTYADAGRFNADAQNTFTRDSNAFIRDAFMADFNLAANEWAKSQDQFRLYEKMSLENKYTLERDAIQNGYQSARDAILNGYTIARDNDNNTFTLQRDATLQGYTKSNNADQNAFTLQRDAAQNAFNASQAELDRQAAMARVAAGQTADTSMDRLAAQINADKDVNALKVKQGAQDTITNARSQLNKDLINIKGTAGLDTAVKDQMVADAINSYNTIVNGHLSNAGWSAEDWSYKVTAAPAPAPAASTNVVQNVTQGGDGG